MTQGRRQFLQLAASAVSLRFLDRRAMTQESYPSRPVHLIVGFTPGSAADITARAFSNGAADLIGQQVVVEDKPGAGSSVAAEYVARANKDGYTLFLSTLAIVTSQIMNPDPAFDLVRDFVPISLLASATVFLVVSPQSDLHSVAELIALAKSKPGEVLCANAGVGSMTHLASELFAQRAGIKLLHVPYPGSPQAVNDLIAGRVTISFSPASTVIGQITAGKLKALATAANRRRRTGWVPASEVLTSRGHGVISSTTNPFGGRSRRTLSLPFTHSSPCSPSIVATAGGGGCSSARMSGSSRV